MKTRAALIIFFFAIIIYSNSLGGDFVYDDDYFVVKNISIRSIENIPSFFADPTAVAFSELSQDVYRPITTISYAIDYMLWKFNTFGYHLMNVLLHSLNSVLVYLLFITAFADPFLAFLAAMLFASHPVQTEVVSWISGRSSLIFLFFYLSALITYIMALDIEGRRRILLFVSSAALFVAALFSKEMAVTLPLVLVLYDMHFGREESLTTRFARYIPYFALAIIFVLIRSSILGRLSQCAWWGGSPYHTFLTMLQVMVEYIKIIFVPLNLCAFYVTNIYTSIADARVLVSLAVLLVIAISIPFFYRRIKGISFAILWFFITLIPVSNIVPLRALMAERFLYLPSIGFCLLVAIVIERIGLLGSKNIFKPGRLVAITLAFVILISYSVRTMIRNEDWKDSLTISNSILKVTPLNPWALASLGASYAAKEQHELAIKPLLKAIALSDSYFSPRNILGFSYLEMGRYDDAIIVLNDALKLKPDNLEALNSVGVAYANVERYDKAIEQFKHAIRVDPKFASAYINLGTTYDKMGRYEDALKAYGRVEKNTNSRQDIAISYIRMGDTCIKMGSPETAREYYSKAISLCGRGMEELKKIATQRLNAEWYVE